MNEKIMRMIICGLLLTLASVTSATACPSYQTQVYGDASNGYSTATTSDTYGITVAADTFVYSPTRSNFVSASGNGMATATATLALNAEYGTWSGDSNHYSGGSWIGQSQDSAAVGTAQTTYQFQYGTGGLCY